MGRVDVLDQGELVAGGTTLAGDDGGVGEEELPDLKGPLVVILCAVQYELTLNHLLPYLASTFERFPSQFLYHLHRVAE